MKYVNPASVLSLAITLGLATLATLQAEKVTILTSITIGLLVFIAISLSGWFVIWFDIKKSDISVEFTENREKAFNYISECERHVYTTHFSKEPPPPEYTGKLIQKMNAGLQVRRILSSAILSEPDIQKWLKQFEGHPNYEQYEISLNWLFDFSIFDGKKSILYFPSRQLEDKFDFAMYIEKKVLVDVFNSIFHKLIPKETHSLPLTNVRGTGTWLKDAFHLPYLVIEGQVQGDTNQLQKAFGQQYSKIDLNQRGECFSLAPDHRTVFSLNNNECAICYFINSEAAGEASYLDVMGGIRTQLDKHVKEIESLASSNKAKLNFSKVYLQDPIRYSA